MKYEIRYFQDGKVYSRGLFSLPEAEAELKIEKERFPNQEVWIQVVYA